MCCLFPKQSRLAVVIQFCCSYSYLVPNCLIHGSSKYIFWNQYNISAHCWWEFWQLHRCLVPGAICIPPTISNESLIASWVASDRAPTFHPGICFVRVFLAPTKIGWIPPKSKLWYGNEFARDLLEALLDSPPVTWKERKVVGLATWRRWATNQMQQMLQACPWESLKLGCCSKNQQGGQFFVLPCQSVIGWTLPWETNYRDMPVNQFKRLTNVILSNIYVGNFQINYSPIPLIYMTLSILKI